MWKHKILRLDTKLDHAKYDFRAAGNDVVIGCLNVEKLHGEKFREKQ